MAAPFLLTGLYLPSAERVLNVCAAPGDKTGHLLELCNGEVTALEVDSMTVVKISQNTQRLGLVAKVVDCKCLESAVMVGWATI